ncbi:MAG: 1-acyl-sn-glycerol-3-phosphate acyltransferase [Gammaproteobacteria bacterium]
MDKFEEIRPYYDHEVESKLRELASNKKVINAFLHSRGFHNTFINSFLGLFLSFYLNRRFKKIKSIHQYQNMYEKIMEKIIKDASSGFTYNGLENLQENNSYLFISNHRDITLDPAFLNLALHKNDFSTVNIAVGSNLMDQKWAADLMRLNKSFIIPRSGSSKREIYRSLNLVSEFIFNKVKVENESIWIAQREGRAKDGKDITDPAILKMIHLTKRKELSISNFFNQMNVIPVSISYEFDPNDLNKAKEIYETELNGFYEKKENEDLESISRGISGFKGSVVLNIGNVMNFESNSYEIVAEQITNEISNQFHNHPTNKDASSILNEDLKLEDNEYFLERLKDQPGAVKKILLNQYANSVD